ncbi:ferritin-like domain-containing protein [Dyadobacter sp. CY345]|uniref:ferritin-like domain-containing protein n=1 Tax=Dyadobacter sp. CY345 TaxID=2909335 RepID=UPI001F3E130C|nr:ferritin-like domain-containing protein [Dyadobacter sp. CY345]MCF2444880.1 ferritin-like domain-containing protein [Dyadobacter sp. CY345]
MNIFNIFDTLQKIDGDAIGRLEHASRRTFMNRIGSTLAAAAVPTAFATVVNKAYGATPSAIEVLNYALTLEYLENEFYEIGNGTANLIPAEYKAVFMQIGIHERNHVKFLVNALGAAAVKKPTFDFTAKGAFPAFTDFATFVTLSKAFEDTGVRAYKGQAGNLISEPLLLQYALQIHSVEARHAAIARKILAKISGDKSIKSWITNDTGFPPAVYKGEMSEGQVVQGGLNLPGIAGLENISFATITESFDEPLTMKEVLDIAGPFIVSL